MTNGNLCSMNRAFRLVLPVILLMLCTPSTGCGKHFMTHNRIVGGRASDPKEWPWMAALIRDGTQNYCGGVLITRRHVLSAAHCLERYSPNRVTVRLGEYDFSKSNETSDRDFRVKKFVIHRKFNRRDSYRNDIAILVLEKSTKLNTDIFPVCLPSKRMRYKGEMATVTGWGSIYYGGPSSQVLLEVTVPIWSNRDCKKAMSTKIRSTNLCAGYKEGGKDSCQGDSGGPLLYFDLRQKRWTVIGIVSYGISGCASKKPGVYTRVSKYLHWIRRTIRRT